MTTLTVIVDRAGQIVRRYEKYDLGADPGKARAGKDAGFNTFLSSLEYTLEMLEEKAELVKTEPNRAEVAKMNAEIRRSKEKLSEDLPVLEEMAAKKKGSISEEEQRYQMQLAADFRTRVEAVGVVSMASKRKGKGKANPLDIATKGAGSQFVLNNPDDIQLQMGPSVEDSSEESRAYAQMARERFRKQDRDLDEIEVGIRDLKDLGGGINEELFRQDEMLTKLDRDIDSATGEMRSVNRRMKKMILDLRSSRNFCVDCILIIIILGIGFYFYQLFGGPGT